MCYTGPMAVLSPEERAENARKDREARQAGYQDAYSMSQARMFAKTRELADRAKSKLTGEELRALHEVP